MCGGTLEFNPGDTVAVCDSCGTKQTLPKLDDDRRANLYDRANHFRRNNEFDKAMGIYEQILTEDSSDAEAYWSLVLCRYGIEYVEDPASRRRVPTVNRAQFTSVFDDDNYKSALQFADAGQRELYVEEAGTINAIQKGILAISQKEEPFDVFICYKETDEHGRRTPDSVLANDLYHQLSHEDFKVFFSRITLEDKLGTAYEPYIFAALNSAKVMVVLATKPEYFNAVWVKNEWSRYLALIRNGEKKILIPAYRDMDPYDLPEEFSHLQAQDISKLGFMQDLIRGIKKITADSTPANVRETVVVNGSGSIDPLLKRAFMFLEYGNWDEADAYCEKVLDQDPENAQAYLGKLMAELQVHKQADLKECAEPFDNFNNYGIALRFADDALRTKLTGYIDHINERNENARLENIYTTALTAMNRAQSENEFNAVAYTFASIPEYKDALALQQVCKENAEIARKDAVYQAAIQAMRGSVRGGNSVERYFTVIRQLETISGWKDADEQINVCRARIEEIKAKEEADRIAAERRAKRNKRILAWTGSLVAIAAAIAVLLITVIFPMIKYNNALALIEAEDYDNAYALLTELGEYKDSAQLIYERALSLIEAEEFANAYALLTELGEYKDSQAKLAEIQITLIAGAEVGDTVYFGAYEQDNDTGNGKEGIEWQVLAKENDRVLVISRYGLDCKQYHPELTGVTWETSAIRQWLNETFMNTAFSAEEQVYIPTVTLANPNNARYGTRGGNNTTDQIFLLSIDEAEQYFPTKNARQAFPTVYATAQGAYVSDRGTCWWWLRSPGFSGNIAAYVSTDGSVYNFGYGVYNTYEAVRPAFWIDVSNLQS